MNCKEIMDISARTDILQKAKRCFKYLKLGHFANKCAQKYKKCGGAHHQVIYKGKEISSTQEAQTEAENNTDRLVTATVKGKKEILLQTAQATAFRTDVNKKIPVCILFDGGSQRSYITEELKKKLNLAVEKLKI